MIPMDDNRDGIALTGASDTLPEYIMGTPPTIETLRQGLDAAREDPHGNDTKCQRDRDYYDGPKQLNSEVRAILANRRQPPIYTNRIRPAINGILGVLEASRSDPQAHSRNPEDENAADTATKTLRFIADQSNFGEVKMEVAESYLIEGTGAVIVEMDGDKIVATQIRWREFYADRYSRRHDYADARFMGIAKWVDADVVRERWSVRINEIGDPMQPQGVGIWGGDKFEDSGDMGTGWINTRRRRVLLVEEYRIIEGEWKRIVYVAAGVLEYGPSPYLDEKQRPTCPIVAVSCYIDKENDRYGVVRDMVPIQDEVNASRSRSLHLMNSRQVQQVDPMAPPVDADTARLEAAKADGVLPAGWQIVSTAEQSNANLLRMQEAKGEIERMGPTPAVLGRQGEAGQSGRARLVLQQAGMTELARPMARFSAWELRVYRQMWERARQFWTAPMWVRVTDDTRAAEFLQVNEPVMGQVPQVVMGPEGYPIQIMGEGVVGQNNRIAEMDVDIILDTAPDTANLQQEVWAELTGLVSSAGGLQAVSTPEFQLMLEIAPLNDKQRVIERLKKFREEREQSMVQQLTQQVQQLQAALEAKEEASAEERQAGVAETTARAGKLEADTRAVAADILERGGVNPIAALT